jgi:hypothetical protein
VALLLALSQYLRLQLLPSILTQTSLPGDRPLTLTEKLLARRHDILEAEILSYLEAKGEEADGAMLLELLVSSRPR